ncbi:hypothetical protein ACLKA7_004932 [Drosophila subpalustris]
MANRPDESSEAEGIVLGERAGQSGQYPRRPHDADYIVHSPYDSEQSRATPPNAGGGDMEAFHGADADWGSDEEGRPQRLPDSSAIGEIFAAEVLAAAGDVEVAQDLPWEQLDWVEIPAGWRTFGLGEMIPAVVLDAVSPHLPGRHRYGFSPPPEQCSHTPPSAAAFFLCARVCATTATTTTTAATQCSHTPPPAAAFLCARVCHYGSNNNNSRNKVQPDASSVSCVYACNLLASKNHENTKNTPGVHVGQQQHSCCARGPATTTIATQRRTARPAATHLVSVCASNTTKRNTAPRSATSSNTPCVCVCDDATSSERHTSAGKSLLGSTATGQQWYSRSSSVSPRRRAQDRTHRPDLVPRRRFGNGILVSSAFLSRTFTGDQAWEHLTRVRGQNLGPFRFLSADLVRRPVPGDVESSRE